MRMGAADRMTYRRLVPRADTMGWGEDAVVYGPSLPDEAGPLAIRPRDKLNDFAHIRSRHYVRHSHSTLAADRADALVASTCQAFSARLWQLSARALS